VLRAASPPPEEAPAISELLPATITASGSSEAPIAAADSLAIAAQAVQWQQTAASTLLEWLEEERSDGSEAEEAPATADTAGNGGAGGPQPAVELEGTACNQLWSESSSSSAGDADGRPPQQQHGESDPIPSPGRASFQTPEDTIPQQQQQPAAQPPAISSPICSPDSPAASSEKSKSRAGTLDSHRTASSLHSGMHHAGLHSSLGSLLLGSIARKESVAAAVLVEESAVAAAAAAAAARAQCAAAELITTASSAAVAAEHWEADTVTGSAVNLGASNAAAASVVAAADSPATAAGDQPAAGFNPVAWTTEPPQPTSTAVLPQQARPLPDEPSISSGAYYSAPPATAGPAASAPLPSSTTQQRPQGEWELPSVGAAGLMKGEASAATGTSSSSTGNSSHIDSKSSSSIQADDDAEEEEEEEEEAAASGATSDTTRLPRQQQSRAALASHQPAVVVERSSSTILTAGGTTATAAVNRLGSWLSDEEMDTDDDVGSSSSATTGAGDRAAGVTDSDSDDGSQSSGNGSNSSSSEDEEEGTTSSQKSARGGGKQWSPLLRYSKHFTQHSSPRTTSSRLIGTAILRPQQHTVVAHMRTAATRQHLEALESMIEGGDEDEALTTAQTLMRSSTIFRTKAAAAGGNTPGGTSTSKSSSLSQTPRRPTACNHHCSPSPQLPSAAPSTAPVAAKSYAAQSQAQSAKPCEAAALPVSPAAASTGSRHSSPTMHQHQHQRHHQHLHQEQQQHQQRQQQRGRPSALGKLMDSSQDSFGVSTAWLYSIAHPALQTPSSSPQPPLKYLTPTVGIKAVASSLLPLLNSPQQQNSALPSRIISRPATPVATSSSHQEPTQWAPVAQGGHSTLSSPLPAVPYPYACALAQWQLGSIEVERRELLLERAMMAERLRGAVLESALLADALNEVNEGERGADGYVGCRRRLYM